MYQTSFEPVRDDNTQVRMRDPEADAHTRRVAFDSIQRRRMTRLPKLARDIQDSWCLSAHRRLWREAEHQ